MIAVSDLISKFRYALGNNWGYIYGTAGIKWTQEKQSALSSKTSSNYDQAKKHGSKWIGHYVADCSGLFAWAFKELGSSIAHGSNSIWKGYLTQKGTIDSSIVPGCAVFKVVNTTDFYHIGLYVGNNTVIEAKGTIAGVVTSKLSEWTHYGRLKNVDYSERRNDLQPGKAVVDVPNDGTVRVRERPSLSGLVMQTIREGDAVTVEFVDGEWAKVKIETCGYIMSKYLKNA